MWVCEGLKGSHVRHVEFKMPIRYASGYLIGTGCVSLQFRVQVQAESSNFGVVSREMTFGVVSLHEVTGGWRGVEKRSKDGTLGAFQCLEGRTGGLSEQY